MDDRATIGPPSNGHSVFGYITGGGIGTALMAVVNNLDENEWKSWLSIAVPPVAVLLSWLILSGMAAIEARRRQRLEEEEREKLQALRQQLERALEHPHVSSRYRDRLSGLFVETFAQQLRRPSAKIATSRVHESRGG